MRKIFHLVLILTIPFLLTGCNSLPEDHYLTKEPKSRNRVILWETLEDCRRGMGKAVVRDLPEGTEVKINLLISKDCGPYPVFCCERVMVVKGKYEGEWGFLSHADLKGVD